jgi:hypothetical protein
MECLGPQPRLLPFAPVRSCGVHGEARANSLSVLTSKQPALFGGVVTGEISVKTMCLAEGVEWWTPNWRPGRLVGEGLGRGS